MKVTVTPRALSGANGLIRYTVCLSHVNTGCYKLFDNGTIKFDPANGNNVATRIAIHLTIEL